jgi:DNA-binding SARP family transcriptional activator
VNLTERSAHETFRGSDLWGSVAARRVVSLSAGADPAAVYPAAPARLELLGGFELHVDGDAVRAPLHVQRLLAFLALQTRPRHRAYVSGRLWHGLSQEHAFACLRTTLWRVSRLPSVLVEATSTYLALALDVVVDARELQASAERVLVDDAGAGAQDIHCLVHAEELLPDWYDDWLLEEREPLRQLRLLALESAADRLIGARSYSEATRAAIAAVHADPLRDSATRLLIRSYLASGNLAEALHQFRSFRLRLARDLGLEPSPQMLELMRGLA